MSGKNGSAVGRPLEFRTENPGRCHGHWRRLAAAVGGVLLLCGCHRNGEVLGVVTLDGVPVMGAVVTFLPEDASQGTTCCGQTDAAGNYRIFSTHRVSGAPVGRYDVTIEKPDYNESEFAELVDSGKAVGDRQRIPLCYASRGALRATVQRGEQRIDFALRSTP